MARTNKAARNLQRNRVRHLANAQEEAMGLWMSRPFGFRLGVALLLVTRDNRRARFAVFAALFVALASLAYAVSVTVVLTGVWS